MKKAFTLCAFLSTISIQLAVFGQPFNKDLYVPMPLQRYTPPRDTAYKENKLEVFNMVEKKFDTVQIENYLNNLNKKNSPSSNEQRKKFIKSGGNQTYSFTNLLPADTLAGFPNYPMSAVVKLYLTFYNPANGQNSLATCSGIIISPGFILTAGHCVKSKFDSSYAVSAIVVPAYNLGSQPFGLTTTTNWYSFTQWTTNGNLDYDMAIMSLTNPIGNTTGWLGWGFNSNDSFFTSPSNVFHNFSYPANDPSGLPAFEEGERMYYMNGHMDFWESPNSMCHYNIAYHGQSGSGTYYEDTLNNRYVHGVLSHGNVASPYFTCHCRMDSSMFNYFNSVIPVLSNIESLNFPMQILIYPNPTIGVFNIDFSELDYNEINLQVFDVLGQQIINESIKQFNSIATINLTTFPAGTYFIRAAIDGQSVNGRICKTE